MAFTYQSIVDMARIPLNDKDKTRYSDDDLLLFANHGMLAASRRRPDLFIGQFDNLPNGEAQLADEIPVEPGYASVIADYVVMRAEMTDDEHANSGRAIVHGKLFNDEMPL